MPCHLWGCARTQDGARLSRQGISGLQENCGHLATCACHICPPDRERRKGALWRVHGCSHPLSPTSYTVFLSPRAFQVQDHRYPSTRAHTHTPSLSQTPAGTRLSRTPTSLRLAPRPLPITRTPRGRNPAPGGQAAQGALRPTRSSREGAAQGSDGQSGRPIEPGTASPKGGNGGSDRPNERGARVGLPPGIPLAKIAGPWVTRKLGGRRRPPRFGSPVSDTGPRYPPKLGRDSRSPTQLLTPASRTPRGCLESCSLCWGRTPSFWWPQSRSGSHREGAGSGRGGTPSAAGGSRAKKWAGGREAGGVWGPARGQTAGKYAEGPLPGPGTRGDSASQKFGGGGGRLGGVDGCAPRGARGLSGRHFPSGPAFVSRVSSSCCVRPPPSAAAVEALAWAEGRKARRRRGRPRRGAQAGLWETGCAPESRSGSSRRCCC